MGSEQAGSGSRGRTVVRLSREEWRQYSRQERERRAGEKRARLLQAVEASTAAAVCEDAWMDRVERAPVYTPTETEWEDPLAYIRSIQAEAAQAGICIVRAPIAPTVAGGLSMALQDPAFKFDTRQQAVRDALWRDWQGVTFQVGKRYTLREFQDAACAAAAKRFGALHGCLPARLIEREYWREREQLGGPPLLVEYGSDVEGTLFLEQDRLGASRWNLNTLPLEPGSALRHCGRPIVGVSTPMLYIGQLFSTFAWHVEDAHMYSINYQHLGASKTWYGVPARAADAFEAVARRTVYRDACAALEAAGASEAEVCAHVERALMDKTTMFSPRLLVEAGVRVVRAVQEVGDYVITFPRAYHAGFGNGFQVGEATNFGMDEWWRFGEEARQRYRSLRHPAILPLEQVLCDGALELLAQQQQQQHGRESSKHGQAPDVRRHEQQHAQPSALEQQAAKGMQAEEGGRARAQAGAAQEPSGAVAAQQAQQGSGVAAEQQPWDAQQGAQQMLQCRHRGKSAEDQQCGAVAAGEPTEGAQQRAQSEPPAAAVAIDDSTPACCLAAPLSAACRSPGLVHTFVGMMRRLNHCRAHLEAAGAAPVLACPAGSPEAALSLHCTECQQLCYVATAVLEPAGEPASWRHVCLECAHSAVAAKDAAAHTDVARGECGGRSSQQVQESSALLFVKPAWAELEACCRQLEQGGVPDWQELPVTLTLSGATWAERCGRQHEPGWPSRSQPYAWRPLREPLQRWPVTLRLGPVAAAVKAESSGPLAAVGGASVSAGSHELHAAPELPSPQQVFHVAAAHAGSREDDGEPGATRQAGPRAGLTSLGRPGPQPEALDGGPTAEQQRQRQEEEVEDGGQQRQRQEEEVEDGGQQRRRQPRVPQQVPPAGAKRARPAEPGRAPRADGAPAPTPSQRQPEPRRRREGSVPAACTEGELLALAEEGVVHVPGVGPLQRFVFQNPAGERVLMASAVLKAAGREDRYRATARALGTLLHRAGGGPVCKAVLSGARSGLRVMARQCDVRSLLSWQGLPEQGRRALRQFVAGVWAEWPAAAPSRKELPPVERAAPSSGQAKQEQGQHPDSQPLTQQMLKASPPAQTLTGKRQRQPRRQQQEQQEEAALRRRQSKRPRAAVRYADLEGEEAKEEEKEEETKEEELRHDEEGEMQEQHRQGRDSPARQSPAAEAGRPTPAAQPCPYSRPASRLEEDMEQHGVVDAAGQDRTAAQQAEHQQQGSPASLSDTTSHEPVPDQAAPSKRLRRTCSSASGGSTQHALPAAELRGAPSGSGSGAATVGGSAQAASVQLGPHTMSTAELHKPQHAQHDKVLAAADATVDRWQQQQQQQQVVEAPQQAQQDVVSGLAACRGIEAELAALDRLELQLAAETQQAQQELEAEQAAHTDAEAELAALKRLEAKLVAEAELDRQREELLAQLEAKQRQLRRALQMRGTVQALMAQRAAARAQAGQPEGPRQEEVGQGRSRRLRGSEPPLVPVDPQTGQQGLPGRRGGCTGAAEAGMPDAMAPGSSSWGVSGLAGVVSAASESAVRSAALLPIADQRADPQPSLSVRRSGGHASGVAGEADAYAVWPTDRPADLRRCVAAAVAGDMRARAVVAQYARAHSGSMHMLMQLGGPRDVFSWLL